MERLTANDLVCKYILHKHNRLIQSEENFLSEFSSQLILYFGECSKKECLEKILKEVNSNLLGYCFEKSRGSKGSFGIEPFFISEFFSLKNQEETFFWIKRCIKYLYSTLTKFEKAELIFKFSNYSVFTSFLIEVGEMKLTNKSICV